jgi:hypothetical protein
MTDEHRPSIPKVAQKRDGRFGLEIDFEPEQVDNLLTAIGMVIGQGDGDAFMMAWTQAEERVGRDDRFEQKDPCPICGFTLRTSSFSVFMVPEELVRKYAVKRNYVDLDKPPPFGWAMHQMCAFMCYRSEYDEARRSQT